MRSLSPTWRAIVMTFAAGVALFHLYTVIWGGLDIRVLRASHLLLLVPLAFICYPARPNSPKDRPTVWDLLWSLAGMLSAGWVAVEAPRLQARWEGVSAVANTDIIFGLIAIVVLLEASRRAVTPWFSVTVAVFLAYMAAGPYLPGILYHRGFALDRFVEAVYLLSDEGIFGMLTGISVSVLFVFVVFAVFVSRTEVGNLMTTLAVRLASGSVGGPAKVSTIASGLYGSISGSSVANVYATGSFSIPMMKKIGFKPHFAGAVEAAASTGGLIMPPVMGAGAFIMAEITGIPYVQIAKAALLPSILYYFGILVTIHMEAKREKIGVGGFEDGELVSWFSLVRQSYYMLPLIAILVLLAIGYSPAMAAALSTGVAFLLAMASRKNRMTLWQIVEALGEASVGATIVAVAMASAGIVVVALTRTGLGLSLSSLILGLAQDHLLLSLLLLMVLTFILGMGIPTSASYVIAATIGGQIVYRMGVDPLAFHLFIFYFAIISEVTPPVGVTAFAAAQLAGSEPFRTGIQAFKLGIAGYVVPFIFVFHPALLMRGSPLETMVIFLRAALVIYLLVGFFSQWLAGPVVRGRVLLLLAVVALLVPNPFAWLGGLSAAGLCYWLNSSTAVNTARAVG